MSLIFERDRVPSNIRIEDAVWDTIRRCMEANRKPIFILLNRSFYLGLLEAFSLTENTVENFMKLEKLLGVEIMISNTIKTFHLVDNREWYEQRF